MPPRHFWWLAETLTERPGVSLDDDDKKEMLDLLRRAKRGDFVLE
jgi:hypothetical protein